MLINGFFCSTKMFFVIFFRQIRALQKERERMNELMQLEINKIDDCSKEMSECYDFHSFHLHSFCFWFWCWSFCFYLIAHWVNIENWLLFFFYSLIDLIFLDSMSSCKPFWVCCAQMLELIIVCDKSKLKAIYCGSQ